MGKPRILIVEDEAIVREDLLDLLRGLGYEVAGSAMTGPDAVSLAAELGPDLVLMDIQLKGPMDGIEAATRIRVQAGLPVVFLTAFANERTIERAKMACPYGYLTKPFNDRSIRATIEVALHRHREERQPMVRLEANPGVEGTDTDSFHGIIGSSDVIRALCQQVTRVARVDATVLIEGETGAGKELVARALHQASARAAGPFVAVNCAGLTETLAAAELFGHRRGAFTGAVAEHAGVFEAAHGGTVFLDEVGDIPKSQQAFLLRVIEQHEVTRVGETTPRTIDVRVVAATHRQLDEEVATGRFRSDLLYRIRVARILVPPLRDRPSDVPRLAEHFLSRFRRQPGAPPVTLADETLRVMSGYAWPGNVRELRNAVEFAALRCSGTAIQPRDLPPEILAARPSLPIAPPTAGKEKEAILAALRHTDGNRSEAARLLGISRATLYRRIAELGLDPAGEKPRPDPRPP